jgi:hypothetical protein
MVIRWCSLRVLGATWRPPYVTPWVWRGKCRPCSGREIAARRFAEPVCGRHSGEIGSSAAPTITWCQPAFVIARLARRQPAPAGATCAPRQATASPKCDFAVRRVASARLGRSAGARFDGADLFTAGAHRNRGDGPDSARLRQTDPTECGRLATAARAAPRMPSTLQRSAPRARYRRTPATGARREPRPRHQPRRPGRH